MLFFLLLIYSTNDFSSAEVDTLLKKAPSEALKILNNGGVSVSDFGMDISTKYGRARDALIFLSQQIESLDGEEKEKAQVSRGWVMYSMGSLDKALNQYEEVLVNTSSTLVTARTLFLIAAVHKSWAETDKAFNLYVQALELYRQIDKKGGIRNCLHELAWLSKRSNLQNSYSSDLGEMELDEKMQEIYSAQRIGEEGINAFFDKDYRAAIDKCLVANGLFEKGQESVNGSWCKAFLGLSYAAIGDEKNSIRYSVEVDKYAQIGGYHRLENINAVAIMLRRKCKDYHFSTLLENAETYAAEQQDTDLVELVKLVKTFDCLGKPKKKAFPFSWFD